MADTCMALLLSIIKKSQKQRIKLKKMITFFLVFIITFSLTTALALFWKPQNFDHRVLRLTLEHGNHTVAGNLEEIVLDKSSSGGNFTIGFHFFNLIKSEPPKDIHIGIINPSEVDYSYCALDGKKFDDNTDTRKGLGFGHSFNIDILLKVRSKGYIGGIVFSNQRTGEVYATIPVYIIPGVGSSAGGGCCD